MKSRRIFSTAFVCTMAYASSCVAQTDPTFNIVTANSGPSPLNIFSVDVNNDGIPDIVQNTGLPPNGFTVSLANGDGSFRAPVFYAVDDGSNAQMQMASGDFNGDGKVDLLFALPGSNQLALLLGNGDGTFAPAQFIPVALAQDEAFSSLPVLSSDFNHDGKLDVVVAATTPPPSVDPQYIGPQNLYLLAGNGNGSFAPAVSIYTVPTGAYLSQLVRGDFDGDNNSDVALLLRNVCDTSANCSSQISVLYGDGQLGFEGAFDMAGPDDYMALSAGDLNGDGRTDLFFIDGIAVQLDVLYAEDHRDFLTTATDLPNLTSQEYSSLVYGNSLAMADFNDDGRMDLVTSAYNPNPQSSNLIFFLADSASGPLTWHVVPLPVFYYRNSDPVVGDYNGDTKPDVVIGQSDGPYNMPNALTAAINSTSGGIWSDCNYPLQGQGITLCSPIAYDEQTISFNASSSSYGQLRKMELWIDGQKVAEQHHAWGNDAWLNFSGSYSIGTHNATLFAADTDNTLRRLDFAFTQVSDGCPGQTAPGGFYVPGVNICKPGNGASVPSPVVVQASTNPYVGATVARMEIWMDGVKKFTQLNGDVQMNAAVEARPGKHRFDVYMVQTDGTKLEQTVYATVP